MLLYLLKVLDGAWVLSIIPPLIYYPLGHDKRSRFKNWAAAVSFSLGILAAFLYAVFKRNTGWVVREYYDLILLGPLIPLCLLFLVFFCLSFRRGNPGWTLRIVAPAILFLVLARVLPDIFIAPLDFDVGMDSIFNMEYLLRATGYACGLILLFALWLALGFLIKRLKANAARLLIILAFLVTYVYFLVDAARIMYVRRIFLSADWIANAVIFFMGHENFFIFLDAALLSLAALVCLGDSVLSKAAGGNPALVRKSRYALILKRRSAVFLLFVLGLIFFTAQNLRAVHEKGPYISEPEEVFLQNGAIALPLEVVGDGNLHRYVFKTESGVEVRFIVIKKSANAYGVGLDACDICGATGYYQRGDQVICKLCDVVMNKTTIGFPGGCNPVPLNFKIRDGALTIDPADLEAEKRRFE
jgi:uncharacterized membrane protein